MKTIIFGSRSITNWKVLAQALKACPWQITAVVSGHAAGVDALGEAYAKDCELPCEVYPARWDLYGSHAGRLRNELMLGKAKHVLAVWDGNSNGTRHMITIAKREGAEVFVYEYDVAKGQAVGWDHFPAKAGGTPNPDVLQPARSSRKRR